MAEEYINSQLRDAVDFANHRVMGHAGSQSASMLDALMAETVGMAMYNAVNTQHNAQMVGNAAVAASCARMLKVQGIPWLPPTPLTVAPVITSVVPTQGVANSYTVAGVGFAPLLTAELFQSGALLERISGKAITNVTPISFALQSIPLSAGTYAIQVVNTDGGRSAPFSFDVSTTQLIAAAS